jgi:hypothetical protein
MKEDDKKYQRTQYQVKDRRQFFYKSFAFQKKYQKGQSLGSDTYLYSLML